MADTDMTKEEMRQKANEVRKAAKALQQKLQTVTDFEERKQLAKQMNDLFAQASLLMKEAKSRHWFEQRVEREFLSLRTNLED